MLAAHQFKDKRNTDIVLIPQPSDDINDPLNWPSWKKTLAFAPIVIFTALGTWVIGGLGTALVLLMIEFEQDLNSTATGLISWSVLAFGAGVNLPSPVPSEFESNVCRTFSGFPLRCISVNDLLFSFRHFYFLERLFGVPRRRVFEVLLRHVCCVLLREVLLKALLLRLVQIYSFFMSGDGGWVFMSSF